MDFTTYLTEELRKQLPEIIANYEGEIESNSLFDMETEIESVIRTLGAEALKIWLEAQEDKYPEKQQSCTCGQQAEYVRRREGMCITIFGRINYRRYYYLCPDCGQGFCPVDEKLGLQAGQMSQRVISVAGLVGVQGSFETGRDLLKRLLGLEISANSIRQACQQIGETVIEHESEQVATSQDLEAQRQHRREADKPRRLYGSLDGFSVHYDGTWHEVKAGTWWTANEKGQINDRHYYVDTASADKFSELVWATGFEQKADQALELVFVADAAEWIWRIVENHFPHAVQIVDWYHACEYLAPVAHSLCCDQPQREKWLEQVTTDLWEGRTEAVIQACAQFIKPELSREDDPAQRAVTYFSNNRHRMNYPDYRERGYYIGSGVMESACKQLGTQRLKIAGAQWKQAGALKVAKARAAYLSGQWDKVISLNSPLAKIA